MFDFLKFILPQPQKIISPLPQSESPGGYNDPTQAGLNYYYQREGQNQALAQANPAQTPQSQGFDVNSIGQALQTLVKGKPEVQAEAMQTPQNNQNFLDKVGNIADKYGLPQGVAQGIWAMEGRGKTINPNNPYNIGAYDLNPQNANAYNFKNPIQGAEEAIKFLAGKSEYQTDQVRNVFKTALDQFKKDHNASAYMSRISPVYSTNPTYAQTVLNTPEYKKYAGKN